jgi:CRISPR-associated protein Cas5t
MMMKAVRLQVKQQSAHYRREETVDNKMTYPLPFPSTVIGALHAACGYTSYHPMDVGIQGHFGSLQREVYVNHCFLSNVMDDRGLLVKVPNPDILTARFQKVAKAKKPQGNSFKNGITIDIINEELLTEYQKLIQKRTELEKLKKGELHEKLALLEVEIKELKKIVKNASGSEVKKAKEKLQGVQNTIQTLKEVYKDQEYREYTRPISYFKSLTTAPQYCEVLYDVELILYIHAEEQTMQDIIDHIGDLQSLGRSEDFVDVQSCNLVELTQDPKAEDISSACNMYVHPKYTLGTDPVLSSLRQDRGTKYYANKNYTIDAKHQVRNFVKIPVAYGGAFDVDVDEIKGTSVWIDETSTVSQIVDLL